MARPRRRSKANRGQGMGPIEYLIDLYGRRPILGIALLLLGAALVAAVFGYFEFSLGTGHHR